MTVDSTNLKYKSVVSQGKDSYIHLLKSWRWFIHKNEQQKYDILKRIEDSNNSYVFLALSDYNFDTEGFTEAESYKYILQKLIEIAGIQNQVFRISVTQSNELISVIVVTQNKDELTYSIDLRKHQDWIDLDFVFVFFNEQLLRTTGTDKKILGLPATDQSADLIFISEADYNDAIEIGIIPAENYFFE